MNKKQLSVITLALLWVILAFTNTNLFNELNYLLKLLPQIELWSFARNFICIPVYVLLLATLIYLFQLIKSRSFHFNQFKPIVKHQKRKKSYYFQTLTLLIIVMILTRSTTVFLHSLSIPAIQLSDKSFFQIFFLGF
ncbi:hypothetical protein Fluta_2850 [Fluviicola taffensis DSM 16823]|uniref:Uncharacterized protein n=1 Tax=Fluviicola taffensis (strain DSM 16823 / NCIMB 13979 / RW262) TaxID=755732 RepID=F2IHQ1_FLUTR|nr:hypothetical protein Fluta_2850 [Fluviicola taffensis DSM 16823]